jgi:photosystem II stability/assembly factor-like uncharacterized protein
MSNSNQFWAFSRAFVFSRDRAYVLATLPELEEQHLDFTQVIRKTDEWASFRIDWTAVHLCVSEIPELTLLCMGLYGRIYIATSSGFSEEEVDISSEGPANRGDLRDIRLVGEHVYVTGMGRQVYRRDKPGKWVRIDQGVLTSIEEAKIVGFNSIDGFDENNIFAVGWGGEIWRFDAKRWNQLNSPTNLKLERVVCVEPEIVYICGQSGVLLRCEKDKIDVIDHGVTELQFWGMEWFNNTLWLSTQDAVYKLNDDDSITKVNFGKDEVDSTCGWLHASSDLMWSVGGEHIYSTTDGAQWELEIVP